MSSIAVNPQSIGTSIGADGASGVAGRNQGVASDRGGVETREAFRAALTQASALTGNVSGTLTGALADAKSAVKAAATPSASFEKLKFSSHAVDRMKSRGIAFTQDDVKGIESAVQRAAQKGSRDTLVLAGDNALIVSVKNNTVVTVMDRTAMRENVFTNIDSTVVV